MKMNSIRVAMSVSAFVLAIACAPSARADEDAPHVLGDHPAVVVQRLQKRAGYDYASKFYPHPAWLRLYAAQPRDEVEVATAVVAPARAPTRVVAIAPESAAPAPEIH